VRYLLWLQRRDQFSSAVHVELGIDATQVGGGGDAANSHRLGQIIPSRIACHQQTELFLTAGEGKGFNAPPCREDARNATTNADDDVLGWLGAVCGFHPEGAEGEVTPGVSNPNRWWSMADGNVKRQGRSRV
jgi:hypothetical protein